ncbi:PepSY domain-containing protein [Streptomyces sp. NPDC091272]|uniref:PepSY domain-containing protein n=1 Tax=Streptomyces sp. NPDC091272 TaxID=3365981 RepID=UPI00382A019E
MKRKFVIATAVAVVLVGGGTATALSAPSDDAAAASASASGRDEGKQAPAGRADAAKAVGTAASAVPGTVTGADLEDDGREWDVDVFGKDGKWYDVTLDPAGAKVLAKRLDADDDDRGRHAPQGAPVTVRQAMDAALKAAPGTVTEADLEKGHWEIEVHDGDGRGKDVNVDAKTGKATPVKAQDDDRADADGTDHDGADDNGTDDNGADDDSGAASHDSASHDSASDDSGTDG